MQENDKGERCVIEFYSKQLTATQARYSTAERECLAILKGLERFRTYLLFANRFKIIVRSDHRGLTSLYKHADESSRLFRWALKLNEFDYDIEYMPGKSDEAALPDGLSRARVLLQTTAERMDRQRHMGERRRTRRLPSQQHPAHATPRHTHEHTATHTRLRPAASATTAARGQTARMKMPRTTTSVPEKHTASNPPDTSGAAGRHPLLLQRHTSATHNTHTIPSYAGHTGTAYEAFGCDGEATDPNKTHMRRSHV